MGNSRWEYMYMGIHAESICIWEIPAESICIWASPLRVYVYGKFQQKEYVYGRIPAENVCIWENPRWECMYMGNSRWEYISIYLYIYISIYIYIYVYGNFPLRVYVYGNPRWECMYERGSQVATPPYHGMVPGSHTPPLQWYPIVRGGTVWPRESSKINENH